MSLIASTRLCQSLAVGLLTFAAAAPAAGQGRDPRPVSVGAAAGVALPLHGDLDFAAPSWQVDVRIDTAQHFGFSVFYEEWRRPSETVLTDQTLSGPGGVLGRVDRVEMRTELATRTAGWSFLTRGRVGRVTIRGGGGVSYLAYTRDFSQTFTGCTPATLCRDTRRTFGDSRFAGQLEAGADVAVTPHLALMGQYRLILPVNDPGGGHGSVTGGVRFMF